MIALAWIVIIALASLAYFEWGERQRVPNQHIGNTAGNGKVSIELQANRQHQYLATGEVNDMPAVFIVDTGATNVVIPQQLAQQAELRAGRASKAMTANGLITVYDTIIPTLSIGPLVMHDVVASINPAMQGRDVLLGMSALKDMEIQQSSGTHTIEQNFN